MAKRQKCRWPGCEAMTIFQDGVCNTHRRVTTNTSMTHGVRSVSALSVSKSMVSGGRDAQWAEGIAKTGKRMIERRPVVKSMPDHTVAVTNWCRDDDRATIDSAPPGWKVVAQGDGYACLVPPITPEKITLGDNAQKLNQIADDAYKSRVFLDVAGGSGGRMEQYDDPAQAISQLGIGKQFGGARISYRMQGDEELAVVRTKAAAGDVEITYAMKNRGVMRYPDGAYAPLWAAEPTKVRVNSQEVDPSVLPDSAQLLGIELSRMRSSIQRYSFQVDGHEGTHAFFIPHGWDVQKLFG